MDVIEIIRLNLFSPMVLAFVLGIIAVLLKSDLKIPEPVYDIISIYLLFAIGLKGGFDLGKSPLETFWGPALMAAFIGAFIPFASYFVLRIAGKMDVDDAASVGIHYGAVSAVTLSAAVAFLLEAGQFFEGFMPTMYAIMEIPAVIVGLLLYNSCRQTGSETAPSSLAILKMAVSGKSFLLLGGGVLIGFIAGEPGARQVGPFFVDLFPGMLTLFLLEMGMIVGRKLPELRQTGVFLTAFGLIMPVLHGIPAIVMGTIAGLSPGGSMILGTLAASASYITAPAVVRANIPGANAALALTASLVITFPFNLIVGLPLYQSVP